MISKVNKIVRDKPLKPGNSRSRTEELKDRDRVWGCVVEHFCDQLVEEKKIKSFYWLEKHGWFKWSDLRQLTDEVLDAMNDQLTTKLGRWYRDAPVDEEKAYHKLVKELVNDSSKEKKNEKKDVTAFFLIYHTISSHKHKEERIDEELWPLLEKLRGNSSPSMKDFWRGKEGKKFRYFYNKQEEQRESK